MIFGLPLGSYLAILGTKIGWKLGTFCKRAPRRVPGRDLGPILGGFGRYFSVFLTLFLMFFWLSFGIAFYMGYVWSVYEVGMAYALILYELCQEIVGEAIGARKETQKNTCR